MVLKLYLQSRRRGSLNFGHIEVHIEFILNDIQITIDVQKDFNKEKRRVVTSHNWLQVFLNTKILQYLFVIENSTIYCLIRDNRYRVIFEIRWNFGNYLFMMKNIVYVKLKFFLLVLISSSFFSNIGNTRKWMAHLCLCKTKDAYPTGAPGPCSSF